MVATLNGLPAHSPLAERDLPVSAAIFESEDGAFVRSDKRYRMPGVTRGDNLAAPQFAAPGDGIPEIRIAVDAAKVLPGGAVWRYGPIFGVTGVRRRFGIRGRVRGIEAYLDGF
ncbi:hypothetical protein ANI02nite_04400 [Acetobacter nitrogenifigens DSM 23921 = NBRC 105050]|uniref:Uncharacterized protein n=1 Tax=Acetobacter nitrogenifigens DSM 23921 = NBRC 105050 TaxID=1120919 RepID=A0A511X6H6_9PROT|nr:hypothetical protein ANI02nite_04400 [Acetobacter nitrogenifigens DSM 23921 = NBRC 105050]